MASGARVTCLPIPMNLSPNGALWPVAGSPGYDSGSPGGSYTGWSTNLGVMVPNNGAVILAFACGATLAGTCQVLIGQEIAGGQVLVATTIQYTIAASSSGWLGPWSPYTYNQTANCANVTYSGAINTQALTSAAAGCVVVDFTTTTTLAVRALALNQVSP